MRTEGSGRWTPSVAQAALGAATNGIEELARTRSLREQVPDIKRKNREALDGEAGET